MIDAKYMRIIEQCEQRIDELDGVEKGFVLGDPDSKYASGKEPLRNRQYLSTAQKGWLDKIVVTRFEGGKWDKNKINLDYGDISAEQTSEGWVIQIAGHGIGEGMSRKEAPVVTSWLDKALKELLCLPKEAFENYRNGTGKKKVEVWEEEPSSEPQTVADDDEPF